MNEKMKNSKAMNHVVGIVPETVVVYLTALSFFLTIPTYTSIFVFLCLLGWFVGQIQFYFMLLIVCIHLFAMSLLYWRQLLAYAIMISLPIVDRRYINIDNEEKKDAVIKDTYWRGACGMSALTAPNPHLISFLTTRFAIEDDWTCSNREGSVFALWYCYGAFLNPWSGFTRFGHVFTRK